MDVSPLHLTLQIDAGPDTLPDELDALARQLLDELRETEVESAALATAGAAPDGTKSAEAITLGAVAVAVLPTFLPKLVEFVQAWSLRGQTRTVKFKGKVAGQDLEFEGSADDLKTLLAALRPPAATPPPPESAAKPG